MNDKTEKSLNWKTIVVLLLFTIFLSVFGFFVILYSISKYGPASTHDSVAYLHATESLIKGEGFKYFGYDTLFIQWPPLFPIILSGLRLLGFNLIEAAGYLNALVFAVIILLTGYWFIKNVKSPLISIIGVVAVLVSIPLSYVSKYIWSEPLFILFILLFMISLDGYFSKSTLSYLIRAGIFAALGSLTRYVGVTAIITGCVLLLMQEKKTINKLLETLMFGLISLIPISAWFVRNYLLSGTVAGIRIPAKNSLSSNADKTFSTIALWFGPEYSHITLFIILGLVVLLSLTIIVKNFCNKRVGRFDRYQNINYRILIPLIFLLVYLGYLIVSASIIAFDSINDRLLSPTYIPLVLLIFTTFDEILHHMCPYKSNKVKNILSSCLFTILFAVWLLYPFTEITLSVQDSYENGAGILASKWWEQSQILNYLKEHKEGEDRKVYSNYPDAIYIHTGISAQYTPKKYGETQYGIGKFKTSVQYAKNVYIVWFNLSTSDDIYTVEELKEELNEEFNIEVVQKFYDGTIYTFYFR